MKRLLLSIAFLCVLLDTQAFGQTTPPMLSVDKVTTLTLPSQPELDLNLFWQTANAPYLVRRQSMFEPVPQSSNHLQGDIVLLDIGFMRYVKRKIPCAPNQLRCQDKWENGKWWVLDTINPGFQRKMEETPISHRRRPAYTFRLTIER
jgi:hypothetical protein